MMIRAPDDELKIVLEIAMSTAQKSAVRNLFAGRKLDRKIAQEALVNRVFAALRRYEINREAHEHELAPDMPPLLSAMTSEQH